MSKIYVAAEGRAIPGGWPDGGRPIDALSRQQRRMIETGDLVEKTPQVPAPADEKPAEEKPAKAQPIRQEPAQAVIPPPAKD